MTTFVLGLPCFLSVAVVFLTLVLAHKRAWFSKQLLYILWVIFVLIVAGLAGGGVYIFYFLVNTPFG